MVVVEGSKIVSSVVIVNIEKNTHPPTHPGMFRFLPRFFGELKTKAGEVQTCLIINLEIRLLHEID